MTNSTCPKDLSDRLEFMELDQGALDRLASISEIVKDHLPEALDVFYQKIVDVPQVGHFFEDPELIKHAKGRQSHHWEAISEGKLDGNYFKSSNTIGQVHARIGLEPRWYIGGYGLILDTLIRRVLNDAISETFSSKGGPFGKKYNAKQIATGTNEIGEALVNMIKAVLVDVDIAVSTYFDKTVEETATLNKHIQEVVARAEDGDFSGRLELNANNSDLNDLAKNINNLMISIDRGVSEAGDVLATLANTDLTRRVEGDHKGAFLKLKNDTNAVADKLSDVVGQLRETSRGVKSATGEILAGANDLSERTTKQAATIEETSAAMEQLATTVMENVQKAQDASSSSQEVSKTAEDGADVMHQANEAMERITSSSAKISNIIGMIDDIAFQTNLLALNASVEAARAGEAGKGFAVVAIEVRRLAQSAADASSEVKQLIEQSTTEVDGGSKLVSSAAEKLTSMLEAARKSNALMDSIANESREQASAIDEVNVAVRQMDEMTQHNAALVEETNAAIEQTEAQASELDRIVEVFKLSNADKGSQQPVKEQPKPSVTAKPTSSAAATYLSAGSAAIDSDWAEF